MRTGIRNYTYSSQIGNLAYWQQLAARDKTHPWRSGYKDLSDQIDKIFFHQAHYPGLIARFSEFCQENKEDLNMKILIKVMHTMFKNELKRSNRLMLKQGNKDADVLVRIIEYVLARPPTPRDSKYRIGRLAYCGQLFDGRDLPKGLLASLTSMIDTVENSLNHSVMANIIVGFKYSKPCPELKQFLQYFADQIKRAPDELVKNFSDKYAASTYRHISMLEFFNGVSLLDNDLRARVTKIYEQAVANLPKSKGFAKSGFVEEQLEEASITGGFQKEIHIDGIELDYYLPESKINIETDGPVHAGTVFKDGKRDQYLLEKHGIRTYRIKVQSDVAARAKAGDQLAELLKELI